MFNIREKMFDDKKIATIISAFGLFFSYLAAHCCCVYIFHQPEKPDLSKLRSF